MRHRATKAPVAAVTAAIVLAAGLAFGGATDAPAVGEGQPPTSEGWQYIRGPGALVPTDREYDGERAIRLNYEFENPYADNGQGDTVLAVRSVAAGERDWSGLEAIQLAVDSNDTAGLRSVGVQIQLLSRGGAIVQSPLISLDTTDWRDVTLPFYRFLGLPGAEFNWEDVLQERIVLRYQGGPFEAHSMYIGGWERITSTATELPDAETVETGTVTAELSNGVSVDFVVGADDSALYGLGEARIGGTALRTGDRRHLIRPTVRSATGRTFDAFRFEGIEVEGNSVALRASAIDGDVRLRWVLTPRERNVRGQSFEGFGYRYELESATEHFERIEEPATWELGGSSVGNTAVIRGSSSSTEVSGSLASSFDTSDHWHSRVRFAHGDAFEYQAGPAGQLYVTYDRADLIEAHFRKSENEDVFHYSDTFLLPEKQSLRTAEKWVLHARGAVTDATEIINAHTAVRDAVYGRLREGYGITVSPIVPQVSFYEEEVQQPLNEIIQNGWLDDAADLGFRSVNLGRLWDSDPQHGGPSNVEGVTLWNFDVAEEWGGNSALGDVIDTAHDLGLSTRLWSPSAQMSRNSPDILPHPDWQVVNRYGALGGNYWSLAGIDMTHPAARSYLLDGLAAQRTEQGLDGLWLDSFHDLGFHIFDHANDPARPHVEETLEHVKDLRSLGYDINVEGYSPFGVSSNLFEPERFANFYQGHEYRAYEMAPHFTVDPGAIDFYRFAANKALLYNSVTKKLEGEPGFWDTVRSDSQLRDEVSQTNHDYNAVAQYMDVRRLLPHDRGVVWTQDIARNNTLVLFSFEEFEFSVPGKDVDVFDVTTGRQVPVENGQLTTQPLHTYKVTSRAAAELCSKIRTPCG